MFFLRSRKSNIIPNSVADFNPQKQLLRQGVKVLQGALVVLVKWSKTNQFGYRLLKIPLTAIPGSVLCPVSAFLNMIGLVPASDEDLAFGLKGLGSHLVPLIYGQLQGKIKGLIAKTGREQDLYSSHSFRRGGCSWAFKSGVSTDLIQHHGDWFFDCYKNYLMSDFGEK